MDAQAEILSAKGCDEFQGYLFSKPLPADDFTDWVSAMRRDGG